MLILPPGHAESVHARRALSARERRFVGGAAVVLGLLAIALVISFASAGPSSSNGCIYATIPAATGAQQINQCGVEARDTCGSARTPGGFTPDAEQTIAAACRRAGLPVGP